MPEPFRYEFTVSWEAVDANGHMRNSAYLDAATNTRLTFFQRHGFPVEEFARLRIGPVVLKDVLEYRRELRLLDEVKITLETAGQSPDGSRFRLCNTFYRADGVRAAVLISDGGWMDLKKRRLTRPPEALLAAMQAMSPTDDFEILPAAGRSSPQ